ncbi:hypothetical protein V1264_008043 [Littorina saxatilis]|uniref:Tc1-like transposase DDE domain-containing protein n=1 Tax=Littorina saxatilis TaxID=31220 RepID=A0AAN9G2G5_9CAEN
MPPRRKLNEFERGRAVAWFQDGVPKREVARRLHVSISVIVRLIQPFTATGRVQERRRPGRPKKTTPREDRLIERLALQTKTASSSIIRRQRRVATNINISQQTIRNRLHGFNLRFRRPAGNLTGLRYRDEILRPLAVPTLQQMGPQAVHQDDNARPHRVRVVNDFLQQSGVNRMEWPACSPDLNPIENLWDELDRKVRSNLPPPRVVQHLYQMLQAEWQALPQRIFTTLVNSMRTRCVECQNSQGGYTHY